MKPLPHFLVVDDDDVDILTIKRAFSIAKVEARLDEAHSGEEALEFLTSPEAARPLTILLDINMPRMNGFELLDKIRADPALRMHQVFMLTTSDADQDRLDAYDRYVAGYIVKPLGFEAICDTVRTLVDLWKINSFPPTSSFARG